MQASSPDIASDVAAASRYHAAGETAKAEAACVSALKKAPRNVVALMMLAELAGEKHDTDNAIALARRAVKAEPDNALCHFTLGRLLHAAEMPAEAERSYRKAAALRPDFAMAHCNLAIVQLDLGEPEDAWASGIRAVELDWSIAEAHMTVGRALLQLTHIGQAVAALRVAVETNPSLGRAQHHLGIALQRLGQFAESVQHHRNAVTLEPELAESWAGLGLALRAFGKFDEAIAAFRRSIEIAPDFGEAHRDLAMCQRAAASEAELGGMRAMLADPQKPKQQRISAAYGLGKFFDDIGEYDEAFANYAKANAMIREEAKASGIHFDPDEFHEEVDAAIAQFTAEFLSARSDWGNQSALPIFVVGHFRSGTTLTEQILASHPDVFGAGELPHTPHIAKRIASPPSEADRWTREQIRSIADQHIAELRSMGPGALRVVDKHPQNVFNLGLIATLFPNAKVICCHRDVRDNVLSCFFQRFNEEMAFATDIVDCGRRHLETERIADHWRKILPIKICDLHYEELVGDLEGQARKLIEFIGLDWNPACMSFYETERAVNTPSTWQVRQPIYSSSVGRWRNYERNLVPLLELLADTA